ncbi:MAG: hypothetical protein KA143_00420 [Saprospiraceae bacterium]|nr:hypothetical protein [Saprospiraceae bacterium]
MKSYKIIILFFSVSVFSIHENMGQAISKQIDPKTKFLKVYNGHCGIVIPWQDATIKKVYDWAPIQSLIYADGKWSDHEPNKLTTIVKPYSFTATIIREDKTAVQVLLHYKFKKQHFYFGRETYPGAEAGDGYYKMYITVWAGSKTISIAEDLNYDIFYALDINQGLQANQGRYRGFMANNKEEGYEEPSGQVYRREYERGYPMDATVDLDFSKDKMFYWFIGWSGPGVEIANGRYWQLYDNNANPNANLFGIYQGRASKLFHAAGLGPRIHSYPDKKSNANIELVFDLSRRGADNVFYPHKKIEWNFFIGTKNDLKAPDKQQEIGNDFNSYAGLATRIKDYANRPVKLVPSFFNGSIYLSSKQIAALTYKLKTDPTYLNYIQSFDDGINSAIWDVLRNPQNAKKYVNELIAYKNDLINAYINGDGHYSIPYRFSYGVRFFRSKAFLISAMFANPEIKLLENDKKELIQLIGLIARILWDNDAVPIDNESGLAMGTANIIHQYNQAGRYFFALLLADDPEFKARAREAYTQVNKELTEVIYDNGSAFGSPHYIGAALEPVLTLMLQLRNAGYPDLFNSDRIKKFTRFYLSLFTPKSVRFAGNRKIIAMGDGTEESTIVTGLLAAGMEKSDPALSRQLYGLYFNGPGRAGFHCLAPWTIDLDNKENIALPLSSCSYDGYHSNIRIAANTPIESSIWCVNGNKYFDHRNDDEGELILYALGAPLSLSRGSFYSPRADAAQIRSMVIPESLFPAWAGADQPISNQKQVWYKTSLLEFAECKTFAKIAVVSYNQDSTMLWYRTVVCIYAQDSLPVIVLRDSVTGSEHNIWSMTNMSAGAILINNQSVNPEKKVFDYRSSQSQQLPLGTSTQSLRPDLNTFSFTGQEWPLHPTKGIDWDIYSLSNDPISASTAMWSNTYQSNVEADEFQKTNQREYEEVQQLLRLRYGHTLTTIIIPRLKKTVRPLVTRINNPGRGISINSGITLITVYPQGYSVKNNQGKVTSIGKYTSDSFTADGFQLEGESMELTIGTTVDLKSSGKKGLRKVTTAEKLPSAFTPGLKVSTQFGKTILSYNQEQNLFNKENR